MDHRRGRGMTEKAGFQATGKTRKGIRIPLPGLQKMLPVFHSHPTTSPPHHAVPPASGPVLGSRGQGALHLHNPEVERLPHPALFMSLCLRTFSKAGMGCSVHAQGSLSQLLTLPQGCEFYSSSWGLQNGLENSPFLSFLL